jgi:hypothetical protein
MEEHDGRQKGGAGIIGKECLKKGRKNRKARK